MLDYLNKTLRNIRSLNELIPDVERLQDEVDALRSRIDLGDELFNLFQKEQKLAAYQAVFSKAKPLVSVCVATYNRASLLIERSLRSILEQDYTNLEIIVVGDCCTDNTEELVSQIKDERLTFINLPQRGAYPADPHLRWMVAGTIPINHALGLATGDFITHLDDDDAYTLDRISRLVAFIQETRADLVWHPFLTENKDGRWNAYRATEYKRTQVTTSSVLYHSWFKRVPWDLQAYKYQEPGDWNRFRKFKYLNAKIARYPEPLLKHYRERNQS